MSCMMNFEHFTMFFLFIYDIIYIYIYKFQRALLFIDVLFNPLKLRIFVGFGGSDYSIEFNMPDSCETEVLEI